MTEYRNILARRGFIAGGVLLAAVGSMLIGGTRAVARRTGPTPENRPFGLTDENFVDGDDPRLPRRARDLIRIGESGIARDNPRALSAFFHPDFRFHGPRGAELDREGLWEYFAASRAAFDDFTVTRQALVSDGKDFMASRTRFAGRFVRPLRLSPEETLQPNGKRFQNHVVNIFRYAANGQLLEEWVQYDAQAFLDQLRS